jgi:hypothetical protein
VSSSTTVFAVSMPRTVAADSAATKAALFGVVSQFEFVRLRQRWTPRRLSRSLQLFQTAKRLEGRRHGARSSERQHIPRTTILKRIEQQHGGDGC